MLNSKKIFQTIPPKVYLANFIFGILVKNVGEGDVGIKSGIFTNEFVLGHILSETEIFGEVCELPLSARVKLRLLAEEIFELTVCIFDKLKYEFYIEKTGKCFTLYFGADIYAVQGRKKKLYSSVWEDKGIFGRINGVFESLLLGGAGYFSLVEYVDAPPVTNMQGHWDGIEKSIIATIAKDMVIGVRDGKVEMVTVVEFN